VSIGFGGSFFKSRELRAVIGDETASKLDTAGAEEPRRTTGATVRRPNGVNPLN